MAIWINCCNLHTKCNHCGRCEPLTSVKLWRRFLLDPCHTRAAFLQPSNGAQEKKQNGKVRAVRPTLCNFPIFGPFFAEFSPEWGLKIVLIILKSYCSKGRYSVQNRHRKIPVVTSQRTPYNIRANTTDVHGVRTTTLVRTRGGLTAL